MGVKEIIIGGNKLIIHELEDVYDSDTGRVLTGSWVWNSALILSQWISTQSQLNTFDFTNKTVLELGAGTGLPGMIAARLGANRVILTDIESLIPGLEKNVDANKLRERVEVSQLVWGTDKLPSQLDGLSQVVDVVLMSDVFIDPELMPAMAKTLKSVCGKETMVWGASEVRPWTYECFNELASEGFRIVELTSQLGDGLSCEVTESVSDMFAVFQLIPVVEDDENSQEWSPITESSDEFNKE